MSDERWNDDIAYAFSIHKTCLRIFGIWPLQAQTVFTRIQWGFSIIAQILILPFLMLDFFGSSQSAGANIETILYFTSTIIALIKNVCLAVGQKKLCVNINAAIDDWLSAKNDKKSWRIMKKYAYRTRILTLMLLYSGVVCFSLYLSVIVFINLKQIFFTDPNLKDANANVTNWMFMIPSGPLSGSVTGSQYAIILVAQIIQTCSICSIQCIADSFFFNVTLHLTGQLEVLKNKFKTFANEPDTESNYKKKFVSLINRHNELMVFYENLEDCFHFLILSQLVLVTILLSLTGLRINICLNENNQIEAIKSIVVLNYLLMQSLVYTYAGDFLQKESEDIFHALYATSWFTLPLALMKDLHFAMMRASTPFRFTGGKFFYVNRETMMYILKTAASYVSVLRIALSK